MSALRGQADSLSPTVTAGAASESPGKGSYRRIVVKAGTNVLAGGNLQGGPDTAVMADLAEQIARLATEDGVQVLLVTSGAIAAGRQAIAEKIALPAVPDIPTRQVLAALGQNRLMAAYAELFERQGIAVSQVLLTIKDMAQRQSYLNIRNTLLSLLDLGVVPVVNENDVVAADEIGEVFGDNDRLSSLIAALIDADLLVILSDVDGLYTADPKLDPTATRIESVDFVDEQVAAMAGEHRNDWARGGMPTKLDAARLVTTSGIAMTICRGRDPDVVVKAARGERVGTFFRPASSKPEARKRWMLSRVGDGDWGQVVVDDGAVSALRRNGVSLLAAGIRSVVGGFERGDIIYITDGGGEHIACGIANYSAGDVQRIRGMRSDRIVDTLGYHYGQEVVHRNNLVLL
ncbi:MAG: glutamate 5-kinase [Chloroflexi bacterium]|nr:glutamate 5-kinase [Chloroflexota bacterium]MYD49599.1 glutamate 5-kinase [Chloroflexota bacterium]